VKNYIDTTVPKAAKKKHQKVISVILDDLSAFLRDKDKIDPRESLFRLNRIEEAIIEFHETIYKDHLGTHYFDKLTPQTVSYLLYINKNREKLLHSLK